MVGTSAKDSNARAAARTVAPTGFTNPVAAYGRSVGFSITGGYVYRGTQATELTGRYIFGDYGGMIASLTPAPAARSPSRAWSTMARLPPARRGRCSYRHSAEANDGELFALDYGRGHIYRLVFTPGGGGGDNVPQQLSATGCINTTSAGAPPLLRLIPYTVNAPFWSDGAAKERWIGLPNGQNIAVPDSGDWEPPNGTVLVKHFRLGKSTRRDAPVHAPSRWRLGRLHLSVERRQTDATRVTGGATANVGSQTWIFPSEAQCMQCHTQAAGFSLGLETAQQNGNHTYPQTGRTANQLTTLNAINVLAPPIGPNPPAFADPADTSRSLSDRARAYLHTNCANCHRPQGPTPTALDLRHGTPLSQTGACDIAPTRGDLRHRQRPHRRTGRRRTVGAARTHVGPRRERDAASCKQRRRYCRRAVDRRLDRLADGGELPVNGRPPCGEPRHELTHVTGAFTPVR